MSDLHASQAVSVLARSVLRACVGGMGWIKGQSRSTELSPVQDVKARGHSAGQAGDCHSFPSGFSFAVNEKYQEYKKLYDGAGFSVAKGRESGSALGERYTQEGRKKELRFSDEQHYSKMRRVAPISPRKKEVGSESVQTTKQGRRWSCSANWESH